MKIQGAADVLVPLLSLPPACCWTKSEHDTALKVILVAVSIPAGKIRLDEFFYHKGKFF